MLVNLLKAGTARPTQDSKEPDAGQREENSQQVGGEDSKPGAALQAQCEQRGQHGCQQANCHQVIGVKEQACARDKPNKSQLSAVCRWSGVLVSRVGWTGREVRP